MVIFLYDQTFEGLLTALFDAYFRNTFPDLLLSISGEPLPLFYNEAVIVVTASEKSDRVWKGLQKKKCSYIIFRRNAFKYVSRAFLSII
ncbi:hypothetical protein EZS27_043589 [termite gut metagenome]|uniref:Uncharacterized protein n=2 Tax=termite gut metagenome TaxID=433724 RepID=A0A5J4P670_9ZZZZ